MKKSMLIVLFMIAVSSVFPLSGCSISKNWDTEVDLLVVGGGTSGVAAGIQASRMEIETLIVEESTWLGGMLTSAGVSAIDGNHKLPGGLWGEFRDSLVSYYGHTDSLRTGWVSSVLFEPSVGNLIFKKMCSQQDKLKVWYKTTIIAASRINDKWEVTLDADGSTKTIKASVLIDATELGDVAKMCGVRYDIGMDSKNETRESIAPLLSNDIVQDLTYVAILKDYGHDILIPRPEAYDSTLFACACINDLCISPKEPDRMWTKDKMIAYGKLPNNKYMINWPIEGNDYYLNILELSLSERKDALDKAKNHTMNFVYYLQKDLGFTTLGLADDEFPTEDRLPIIPYHRESRRIHGKIRFTLDYITAPYSQQYKLYRTNIAVGDYPVDHHHGRYHGDESLPNLYFYPVPSYGIPLGALIPEDVEGLIVAEKSISVSNLVNGTTRLQPVVLQIGQAAGVLAAIAIKKECKIEDVSVREVQKKLLSANGYLQPYLDVKKDDKRFPVYQRIGSTGILRGEGRNIGWENQTWLRADSLLLLSELDELMEFYPAIRNKLQIDGKNIFLKDVLEILHIIQDGKQAVSYANVESEARNLYTEYSLGTFDLDSLLTRGAFAVLVDGILRPFDEDVDIYGNQMCNKN